MLTECETNTVTNAVMLDIFESSFHASCQIYEIRILTLQDSVTIFCVDKVVNCNLDQSNEHGLLAANWPAPKWLTTQRILLKIWNFRTQTGLDSQFSAKYLST